MRIFRLLVPVLLAPVALTLAMGCGGGASSKKTSPAAANTDKEKEGESSGRTALKTDGWATVKGKVTLNGPPPKAEELAAMKEHKDAKTCLAGSTNEKIDQTWFVNDKGAVENVVVFIKAPEGKYFPIKDADKKRTDLVKLDQPHCAFVPHIFTLFPYYSDGKEDVKSGQKFQVWNSAPMSHNTKIQGDPLVNGSPLNLTMASGEHKPVDLKPQDTPVQFKCDFHPWMNAKAWVLDHPYAAVTNAEGEFELTVPAGAEISLVAWHEGVPGFWALPENSGSAEGQKITLKDGETKQMDFKVNKK